MSVCVNFGRRNRNLGTVEKVLIMFKKPKKIAIQRIDRMSCALAEILWNCNSDEDVDKFIEGLPTIQLKRKARSVQQLIILACIEENSTDISKSTIDIINSIK